MNQNYTVLAKRKTKPWSYYIISAILLFSCFLIVGLVLIITALILNNDQTFLYVVIGILSIVFAIAYSGIILIHGKSEQLTPTEAVVLLPDQNGFVLIEKNGRQTLLSFEEINEIKIDPNPFTFPPVKAAKETHTLTFNTTKEEASYSLIFIENAEAAKAAIESYLPKKEEQ